MVLECNNVLFLGSCVPSIMVAEGYLHHCARHRGGGGVGQHWKHGIAALRRFKGYQPEEYLDKLRWLSEEQRAAMWQWQHEVFSSLPVYLPGSYSIFYEHSAYVLQPGASFM